MDDPRVLIAALALLAYALVSWRLERWWMSMPAAMLVAGVVVGPLGLGFFDVPATSEGVKTVAELTLALMLFHDAVRIDLRALRQSYGVPLRLLGIGLPVMIVLGTVVAFGMMPSLGLVGAALLATMLAPTDAALGEAVVSDTRLPVQLRQGLNVESGLNDGMSVPVFLVLLAVAVDPAGWESGALIVELGRQIGFGVLGGVLVGAGGGFLLKLASHRQAILESWRRIAIVAIALGSFAVAVALGGSGFIGAFVGGVAFGLASEARSESDNALTGYLGTVFDAVSFLVFGAVVVPFALQFMTWQAASYAILSLVVIRMISVAVAMLRSGMRWQTVAFMGWFGPRGLATLVFTVMLIDEEIAVGGAIAAAAVAGVTLSVLAHGFTAPPLVAKYGEWWRVVSVSAASAVEGAGVHEHASGRLGSAGESAPPR